MKDVKLDIGPNFTLEDIRKVRDYDYEMTKDMTREARSAYYKERGEKALKRYYKVLAEVQAEQKTYSFEVEQSIAAESEFEYRSAKNSNLND
ncbi:MAG: hypothetical protein FWD02_01955 [Bacteroidales bacterium]|nr:hypothetical protein [Bacteroidales bacterium]